jgi:hypothetical protein
MNKTAKIIIGILLLVSVFFLLYAQIKASEAQKQTAAALATQMVATGLAAENEKLTSEVELIAKRAERLAADAIKAQSKVMQLLEDCKGSK